MAATDLLDTPSMRVLKASRRPCHAKRNLFDTPFTKWFWEESKHPRDQGGRFTSGGGASETGESLADRIKRRVRTGEQISEEEAARARAVREHMGTAVTNPTIMEGILGPRGPWRYNVNQGLRGSIPIGRDPGGDTSDPRLLGHTTIPSTRLGGVTGVPGGAPVEWRTDVDDKIGTWGPEGFSWPTDKRATNKKKMYKADKIDSSLFDTPFVRLTKGYPEYNPDQPRNEEGQFSSSGGSGSGTRETKPKSSGWRRAAGIAAGTAAALALGGAGGYLASRALASRGAAAGATQTRLPAALVQRERTRLKTLYADLDATNAKERWIATEMGRLRANIEAAQSTLARRGQMDPFAISGAESVIRTGRSQMDVFHTQLLETRAARKTLASKITDLENTLEPYTTAPRAGLFSRFTGR